MLKLFSIIIVGILNSIMDEISENYFLGLFVLQWFPACCVDEEVSHDSVYILLNWKHGLWYFLLVYVSSFSPLYIKTILIETSYVLLLNMWILKSQLCISILILAYTIYHLTASLIDLWFKLLYVSFYISKAYI